MFVQGRRAGIRARARRAHDRLPELRRQRHVPDRRASAVRRRRSACSSSTSRTESACALNGEASVADDDPLLAEYPEAQIIVRVAATRGLPELPALHPRVQARQEIAVRAEEGVRDAGAAVEAERVGTRRPAGERSGQRSVARGHPARVTQASGRLTTRAPHSCDRARRRRNRARPAAARPSAARLARGRLRGRARTWSRRP